MKWVITLLALISAVSAQAQNAEMADVMRSNGKIYVLVGIILIIVLGMIVYLFRLDRKITRLEKEVNSKNP